MVRYLYDEPHFLLQQEVSEVGSYFSIIKAIAEITSFPRLPLFWRSSQRT